MRVIKKPIPIQSLIFNDRDNSFLITKSIDIPASLNKEHSCERYSKCSPGCLSPAYRLAKTQSIIPVGILKGTISVGGVGSPQATNQEQSYPYGQKVETVKQKQHVQREGFLTNFTYQ